MCVCVCIDYNLDFMKVKYTLIDGYIFELNYFLLQSRSNIGDQQEEDASITMQQIC